MKPLYSLVLIIALATTTATTSCQKATLIEDPDTPTPSDGRVTEETEKKDSVTVTPNIDAEGWGDTIDINFGFG